MAAAALAGCAGFSGSGLVPGAATEADVLALMGTPTDRRAGADGETVLWYPRLPFGRVSYAARIGRDGRLVAIEQRLTEENVARLQPNKTTTEELRDLMGPPERVTRYPRMQRETWTYQFPGTPSLKVLYVQFSPDGVAREIYYMDDPEERREPFFFSRG
jgi:hypothetical protein